MGAPREKIKRKSHDLSHETKASSGQCRRVGDNRIFAGKFFPLVLCVKMINEVFFCVTSDCDVSDEINI